MDQDKEFFVKDENDKRVKLSAYKNRLAEGEGALSTLDGATGTLGAIDGVATSERRASFNLAFGGLSDVFFRENG